MSEEVICFGADESLVGILTRPDGEPSKDRPGVILLNAGILHRVGPNRLHVRIARRLAEMGLVVLRFDFSGIGDSAASVETLSPEERCVNETRLAMDVLKEKTGVNRFVIGGICSGALAAWDTVRQDERVSGVALINPQFSEDSDMTSYVEARDWVYWRRVLFSWWRWRDFLTGKTDYNLIVQRNSGFFTRKQAAESEGAKIAADNKQLIEKDVRLLVVCSAADQGLDYLGFILRDLDDALTASDNYLVKKIEACDHLFTPRASQEELIGTMVEWIQLVR
ncbi:MAG: alpha/beta hydrolase [Verrucomicrobiota bacterium]